MFQRVFPILVLIFALAEPVRATTWYADDSKSDANNCTQAQTPATAKKTITAALACVGSAGTEAGAGHTVEVVAGAYTDSLIDKIPSGSGEVTRFTLKCQTDRACIAALSGTTAFVGFNTPAHYITIQGFKITGGGGMYLSAGARNTHHHINFANHECVGATMHNTAMCLQSSGAADIIFSGNLVYGLLGLDGAGSPGFAHALYVADSNDRWTVENNWINNNAAYGIHFYSTGGTVTNNSIIRKNVLYNNGTAGVNGTGVIIEGGANHRVYQNILYGNAYGGVLLRGVQDAWVYANTAYNNGNGCAGDPVCGGLVQESGVNSAIFKNNLAIGNATSQIQGGSQSFNVTTGSAASHFVSAGTGDFRLVAGSTALNAGTSSIGTLPPPLNGTFSVSFNGGAPEAGAFELPTFASCAASGNTMTVTWNNNVNPPMRNASTSNLTAVIDGTTRTLSSPSIANQILTLTFSGSAVSSTATFAASTGSPISDSALIGGSLNQTIHAVATQNCNVTGGGGTVIAQTHFRFHGLYGALDTPEVKAATAPNQGTDINWTIQPGGCIRPRIKLAATGGDPASQAALWRYSRAGGAYTVIPDAYGADNIKFLGTADTNPAIPTQGSVISTELLTSDHATNVNGLFVRSSNAIPTFDLSQNSEIEIESAICIDADEAVDTTFDLRLYNQDGTPYTTYSQTPRLTVKPPSFTTMSALDIESANPVQVVVRTKPLGYSEMRVDKSMLPLRINGREISKAGVYR